MYIVCMFGLLCLPQQASGADVKAIAPWTSPFLPGKRTLIGSLPEWEEERRRIREGVVMAFGWPGDPGLRPPLDVRVHSESDEKTYTRKKMTYAVEKMPDGNVERVPAWLLVPNGLKAGERRPGILCLHQTNGSLGKDEPVGLGGLPHLHLAKELAERGFICLVPDYPSFGEYAYDWKKNPYASGSIKAVTNNIRGVDLLASLPQVDSLKIGAVGHSLGGHNAMFTAAFEPRIRVVVTSCGFTRMARYYNGDLRGWTSDRYVPRIKERYGLDPARVPFDLPGILALLAPGALFINAPEKDSNFAVLGVRETVEQLTPLYGWLGAPRSLAVEYPDCGHDFPDEVREKAWIFLERQLDLRK